MTYPRAHLVDIENGGMYHCISRCVRRSWLCGADRLTGRSFEHRRAWVEARLLELTTIFAIDLYGYAVMSNHYHAIVDVHPQRVSRWSDEEVARRWLRLSPGKSPEETEHKLMAIQSDARRLAELRLRLGSLSWFMRHINEPIAREANSEDGVKGRFWEGRFKSIALLDETAVTTCMAYVDLNPVRANASKRLEDARHTSIHRRIHEPEHDSAPLAPLSALGLTIGSYRALLEWTVSTHQGDPRPPEPPAAWALSRMRQESDRWLGQVRSHHKKYRAYGALGLLQSYARSLGQRWLCGAKPGHAAPA